MSNVTAPGTSAVADRPVKICPGNEGRPCGKEIPAIRKWCTKCSAERRRLKRIGYNSDTYQANSEPLKANQRERYQQQQFRQQSKVAITLTAWMKSERDRKRDLQFGYDRPLTPRPLPKEYLRMRPRRRAMTFAQAEDLLFRELNRANERLKRRRERGLEPARRLPYRPPRLQDILPQPERAETTVAGGRSNKRRRKKRGRPRLTVAEQLERIERREKRAVSLFVRVHHEKMAYDEAYYAVHPLSKASPETATREAKRWIDWFRKEHPQTVADALYLSGLYDLDEICRGIKSMLKATLHRKGKLIDLPDWYTRIKGLKLLMIGLGLATPSGFRSGPYAVGGEKEHEPLPRNDAPPGDDDSAADVLRRLKAESVFFRHQFEGKPLADCYYELNPLSNAKRTTANKEAEKLVDWYQKRYSSSLAQRLTANGLDELTVFAALKEMKQATLVCDGALSDFPDWRVRDKALGMQMAILGFYPPPGRSIPTQVPTTIARTMAKLCGQSPVSTEDAPTLSPDEKRRRVDAACIYMRRFYEGKALADCWIEKRPGIADRITREEATVAAERELAWFREEHPVDVPTLMEAHDLGTVDLINGIKEMQAATRPLKVHTMWWRDEDGTRRKKITYSLWPDNRAFAAGVRKQAILLGIRLGGRQRRAPLKPGAGAEQPGDDEPLPKTIEEARKRGKPITIIEHPPEISPEEWQRQMDEYQETKKRFQEQYGDFSDEWRAWLRRDLD